MFKGLAFGVGSYLARYAVHAIVPKSHRLIEAPREPPSTDSALTVPTPTVPTPTVSSSPMLELSDHIHTEISNANNTK